MIPIDRNKSWKPDIEGVERITHIGSLWELYQQGVLYSFNGLLVLDRRKIQQIVEREIK